MPPTTRWLAVVLTPLLAAPLGARVLVQLEAQGNGSSVIDLSHPFLDDNPDALLMVGPRDFNADFGVDVDWEFDHWRITANGPNIPSDAHFWVLAFDGASGFRHTTTAGNVTGHVTTLNDPRLNGNPAARPLVMRERSSTGIPVPFPFGTWYNGSSWTIFYQDTDHPMPVGATFSVYVPAAHEQSFMHTANVGNVTGNFTVIDSVEMDHTRPHRIFATQRWIGTYNDAWVAVSWFFSFLIGNANGEAMPEGAAFNVLIAPIFEDGFDLGGTDEWSATVP